MEKTMFYDATKSSFEKAQWLRNHSTKHEQILWNCLRKNRIVGVRIKRQHPIGTYIADFYCHVAKLVIEIDGKSHNTVEQRVYDKERTFNFNILGLMVIRFQNDDVELKLDQVIDHITQCVKERLISNLQSLNANQRARYPIHFNA